MQPIDILAAINHRVSPLVPRSNNRTFAPASFTLTGVFDTGAPSDIDLTQQPRWYNDIEVQKTHKVKSNGGVFAAVLRLHAVQLVIDDADFCAAALSVKDAFLQDQPYLEYAVDGVEHGVSLWDATTEAFVTHTTAAAEGGYLNGLPKPLPEAAQINLETGSLSLKSLADIGTAYSWRLRLFGAIGTVEENAEAGPSGCSNGSSELRGRPVRIERNPRNARISVGRVLVPRSFR